MPRKHSLPSRISGLEPRDGMWDYDGDEPTGDTYSVGLFVWVKERGKLIRGKVRHRIKGFREDADYVREIARAMVENPGSARSIKMTNRSQRAR